MLVHAFNPGFSEGTGIEGLRHCQKNPFSLAFYRDYTHSTDMQLSVKLYRKH
jgi:hypothetical protein